VECAGARPDWLTCRHSRPNIGSSRVVGAVGQDKRICSDPDDCGLGLRYEWMPSPNNLALLSWASVDECGVGSPISQPRSIDNSRPGCTLGAPYGAPQRPCQPHPVSRLCGGRPVRSAPVTHQDQSQPVGWPLAICPQKIIGSKPPPKSRVRAPPAAETMIFTYFYQDRAGDRASRREMMIRSLVQSGPGAGGFNVLQRQYLW
jgi:hypothetical protein